MPPGGRRGHRATRGADRPAGATARPALRPRDPATRWAEVAVVVQENFRRRGIADFLLRHLVAIAKEQGIVGFTADTLADNQAMLATFQKIAPATIESKDGLVGVRLNFSEVK